MKIGASACIGWAILGFVMFSFIGRCSIYAAGNTTKADKMELEEFFVWVENARVREEASLNSAVIVELKGGDKVLLIGESSTSKIKVNLRGVEFEDIWVKIKTQDDKEGWIFKAMLTDNKYKAIAMNDFLIVPGERVGSVTFKSTRVEIENLFGKEFVVGGAGYYFESDQIMPGFTLFKNSPMELQCCFADDSTMFRMKIVNENNCWKSKEGIRNGSTLDELVKLNGKPIEFSGIGWDFGGIISNYNGGALADLHLIMTLDCANCPEEFYGDRVHLNTSNKKLLGKGIKIFLLENWAE